MAAETTTELEFSSSSIVPPRWATPRTPERPTYGANVAAVSEAMGRPLMPHQREIVDVFLEVQSEEAGDPEPGEWAYGDGFAGLERRAGKTSLISPIVAHRARLIRRASMWMTAQSRDKARLRWMDVTDDLLSSVLRDDVRRKIGNMHEELLWHQTMGRLKPFAPNEDGLHSETPDLVLVDELWAFDAEQARVIKAGYVPAMATSSGQAFKMSTAGTEKSSWLNQTRRSGR
jgi:phage terminase large subunit-like protein